MNTAEKIIEETKFALPTKSPEDSMIISRHLVMPDEINPNGSLFGGILMSWIDMAAYMSAQRFAGIAHVVTANIDNIEFHVPLRVGNHVLISSQVIWVGRTSMEIFVNVEKEENHLGTRTSAANALLTFVALDENEKPTLIPTLKLNNNRDQKNYRLAELHRKVRQRISKWYQKHNASIDVNSK